MLTYLNDYPMIQTKLQAVCLLIEERLQIENTEIRKALIDLTNAGGEISPTHFFLLICRARR